MSDNQAVLPAAAKAFGPLLPAPSLFLSVMAGMTAAELEAQILAREPFSLTEQEFKDCMVGLMMAKRQAVGEDTMSVEDFKKSLEEGLKVEMPAGKDEFEAIVGQIKGMSDEEFNATFGWVVQMGSAISSGVLDIDIDEERGQGSGSGLLKQLCVGGELKWFRAPIGADINAELLQYINISVCGTPLEDLENIDIRNTDVSDVALSVLHRCRKLKRVNLWDCQKVSDEGVAELGRELSGRLQYINVRNAKNVTVKTMIELVNSCKNLESFVFLVGYPQKDIEADGEAVEACEAFKKAGFEPRPGMTGTWQRKQGLCFGMCHIM